jgi:hemoglobin
VAEPGPDGEASVHDVVGGEAFFVELVDRFYTGVAEDPVLQPIYPDDLTDSKRWLAGFLIQYWGGSQAYSGERGHPRLRMRHVPFRIGPAERDAWFRHMMAALSSLAIEREIPVDVEQRMREYFTMAAEAMRNAD